AGGGVAYKYLRRPNEIQRAGGASGESPTAAASILPGKEEPTGENASNAPRGQPKQLQPQGPAITLQKLLDGLPENARPTKTDDAIRINRADDWLAGSVGKRVEFQMSVKSVTLDREENKLYRCVLHQDNLKSPTVKVGTLDWRIVPYDTKPSC